MLYYLKSVLDDFIKTDTQAMYARYEVQLAKIPEPPSHLFEWDEEQDMIDMTGLNNLLIIL